MVSAMQNIKPDPGAEEQQGDSHAKANAGEFQQTGRQQRLFAALLLTQRAGPHPDQQRQHGHQQKLERPRPVKFRPQRHRKQQTAEDQRQAEGALPVDGRMGFAAGFRDIAGAKRQHQQADRDIDKERVAPAQAGDIRRDQPAAAHLPDDKSNPTNPAIQTDRARMGAAFQRYMQGGEDLRHNQRRARALQRAGRQQPADGVGHAAQQRGEAKKRDPHINRRRRP